ncbi:sulfur carrier protein ThiS [Lichenicoccus roseus]|uniref:Sulfur carrier protein ThiS n=1 Tax=Lichenicoccus roseus TaxID=2683649 RepID=A0A5R9JAD7_9PROT|nr:sulfur carrier protein ThiS [Lichenicoccus roseus]TLU72571.1 sulfur carrier protein ThiS [Lichenicoccus roseus]
MRILVNGAPHEVASSTLDTVLVELGYTQPRLATALDGQFVPATRRPAQALRDGMRLEIVSPMQGG